MSFAKVWGLLAAVTAMLPSEGEIGEASVAVGHTPSPPEGKGIVVPRQRHAGGCNSAGCRTLDKCICRCRKCREACNGQ